MNYKFLLIGFLFFISKGIKSQITVSVELLDSVQLQIAAQGYSGTLQWQKSINESDWEDIVGATYLPYKIEITSVPVYFRAKFIGELCDDYSEIITVNDSTETGYEEESIAEINATPEMVAIYYSNIPSQKILSMPPVKNQGAQGSCSAWAVSYYLMGYLKNQAEGVPYLTGGNPNENVLCSPAFTFNQIKFSDSDDDCSGSGAVQHLTKIKSQGICTLKEMPYKASDCSTQPNQSQQDAALSNRISQYFKIDRDNLNLIKTIIALGKPMVLAVSADYNLKNLKSPYIWTPSESGSGHSVTLTGYSDESGGFRIVNSWGKSWGDNGYFYMSYPDFQGLPNGKFCYTAFWKSNPIYNDLNLEFTHHYPLDGDGINLKGIAASTKNTSSSTNRKGQLNSAVLFSGNDSYFEALENLSTDEFSVSFWVNPSEASTGVQTIFSQVNKKTANNKGLELSIRNKVFSLAVPVDSSFYQLNASDTIVPGSWYHIAITYDGSFLRLYINGVPVKIGIYTNFFNTSENKLTLACQKGDGTGARSSFFVGKIDDFRIYSRSINDAEVNELFEQ